jgi:hypothetical protein
MSPSDIQEWLATPFGRPEFVRVARFIGGAEYELLLRWASRGEPVVSDAELERAELMAGVVRALLQGWEPVDDSVAKRFVAEQVGRRHD